MGRVNGHTIEEVIEAIRNNDGLLAAAARELGVSRQTVYRYVKTYATVATAMEEARNTNIDIAEHKLIQHIKKGSLPAIMFFLKTVGKSRGYVERQEMQHEGTVNIAVNWDDADSD